MDRVQELLQSAQFTELEVDRIQSALSSEQAEKWQDLAEQDLVSNLKSLITDTASETEGEEEHTLEYASTEVSGEGPDAAETQPRDKANSDDAREIDEEKDEGTDKVNDEITSEDQEGEPHSLQTEGPIEEAHDRDNLTNESETTPSLNSSHGSLDPEGLPLQALVSEDEDEEDEQLNGEEDGKEDAVTEEQSGKESPDSSGLLRARTYDDHSFQLPKTYPAFSLKPKSWAEAVSYLSLVNVFLLFMDISGTFFVVWFLFWRLAYNFGIGYLLYRQSKDNYVVRWYETLAAPPSPAAPLFRKMCLGMMPKGYDVDAHPSAFNAWLSWRILVDWILGFDCMAYFVFCLKYFETPSLDAGVICCYLLGVYLMVFSLWAKTDSYRVVKDFAWYWGDFFFLVDQKLTFDRVFSISPHPMYTIGYGFYYGCSLLTQSYTVLYVSLVAHFCQFVFLELVENPHIEKIYGDIVVDPVKTKHSTSGYFNRDLIGLKNFDPFRATDISLVLLIAQIASTVFWVDSSVFFVLQVILWRAIHSVLLGYILHKQSQENFWNSHFEQRGFTKKAGFESWKTIYNMSLTLNWASFIVACAKFGWNELDLSSYNLVQQFTLRIVLGLVLIALNVWSSQSTYQVLGEFGWFYGDFFLDELPSKLYYTGIYRFLNNPDCVTGFAAYYGLALMADSWVMFFLALFSQASNWLFVDLVEKPHMQELYGNKVRDRSGVTSTVEEIVKEAAKSPVGIKLIQSVGNVKQKAKDVKQVKQILELTDDLSSLVDTLVAKAKETKLEVVDETKKIKSKVQDQIEQQKLRLKQLKDKLLADD